MVERGGLENHCRLCLPGVRIPPPPHGAVEHCAACSTACLVGTHLPIRMQRLARIALACATIHAVASHLFADAVQAQTVPLVYEVTYRPPGLEYRVLRLPHFDVIFESGAEPAAREAAAILESELPRAQARFPRGRTLSMPVVIVGFSDRAGGFVAPFPFRQEIEAVGIKGSRLSARHTSWMWAVAPHEVVHAAQAQSGSTRGVVGIMRRMAPDLARALQLWVPPGIAEGVAVYHESHVQAQAGRLNHPFFQMQFWAAMASRRPWTLAQLLERPAFALSAGRHYVGGANFYRYFVQQDSARVLRRAATLHERIPFLGYGIELWHASGRSPAHIGRRFRAAMRADESARQRARGPLTEAATVAHGPGHAYRRPRWLDATTLVAHARGMDLPQGLYTIDIPGGGLRRLSLQALSEDYFFSMSADARTVMFSRYVRGVLAHGRSIADVFTLEIASRRVSRRTRGARVHAPIAGEGGIWALRNEGQFNQWVRIAATGSIEPLTSASRTTFLQLAQRPAHGDVAVLARKDGRQGIYRARWTGDRMPELEPWLFFSDASIYDMSWSMDGRYLLFCADRGAVANVHALDVERNVVVQLTNVLFGAFEGVLSPDGRTLAYVEFRHEGYDIRIMPFAPEDALLVGAAERLGPSDIPHPEAFSPFPSHGEDATVPYRARRYLRPRILFPVARYRPLASVPGGVRLGFGAGVGMQGGDPLGRWAFGFEGLRQAGRFWGEMTIRSAAVPVRTSLTLYDRPSTVIGRVRGENLAAQARRLGREEVGVRLDLGLPLVLHDNVRSTTARVALGSVYAGERLFDVEGRSLAVRAPNGQPVGIFRSRFGLRPRVQLRHGIRYNRADLAPAAGLELVSAMHLDAWTEGGGNRRAIYAHASWYRAMVPRLNLALRLRGSLLAQNQGAIFRLDRFLPRGREATYLGRGTYLGLSLEVLQPLWHIDNGFLLVPLYLKALYVYGFAEMVRPADGRRRPWQQVSALGPGLGMQLRLFYQLDFDLRLGITFCDGAWRLTYR